MKKEQIRDKTKKQYCVHIYPQYNEYEVQADNPEQAEIIAVKQYSCNDYDDINEVMVMRYCDCGYDNDTKNEVCDECGVKL